LNTNAALSQQHWRSRQTQLPVDGYSQMVHELQVELNAVERIVSGKHQKADKLNSLCAGMSTSHGSKIAQMQSVSERLLAKGQ
jgi:hypothetical protein